jgi:hypothetical protein
MTQNECHEIHHIEPLPQGEMSLSWDLEFSRADWQSARLVTLSGQGSTSDRDLQAFASLISPITGIASRSNLTSLRS